MKIQVSVLGCTGSIGTQALDVIRMHPDLFSVYALSCNRNTDKLVALAKEWCPKAVACSAPLDSADFPIGTQVFSGPDALREVAALPDADAVVMGVSGLDALVPLLAALEAGKRVALANKESIVCGHSVVDRVLASTEGTIIPVDSEQSAIFQCLAGGSYEEVCRLWLTASGGPFRNLSYEEMKSVTPEQALHHPTWSMGKKITVDSATLFNKGLEIMEAAFLFHMPAEKIGVLIHPESVVHSLVEFNDRSIIANMSLPDMRIPIQYALTYPERKKTAFDRLFTKDLLELHFARPDEKRFPAIPLAYEALYAGGSMPTVYHAANDEAVRLFLEGRIRFTDIPVIVEKTMQMHCPAKIDCWQDVYEANTVAREQALRIAAVDYLS